MDSRILRWGLAAVLAVPVPAHAALVDRGEGLIYDSTLGITWLQDANYAKTSGYDTDGLMNWTAATAWATGLSYSTISYGTLTDWRLPTLGPIDSSFNYSYSNNATTDWGHAKTTTGGSDGGWRNGSGAPASEMGHMFYVNWANEGYCTPSDGSPSSCSWPQTGWSGMPNATAGTVSFLNLRSDFYWSTLEYAPDTSSAWGFGFTDGGQSTNPEYVEYFAWAVRPGDVAPVPVPAAVWLFGSAVMGLVGLGRRAR